MKRAAAPRSGHRFTAQLERSTNRLWGCHFRVPPRAADRLLEGGSRRVVCTLNGSATYQCAIIPVGNGTYVITVNKLLRTRLGVDAGATVRVRLTEDTSRYGLPLPEELRELLRQDASGRKLFEALTPGRKRTLLYIVGKAGEPEERVRRALVIIRHLKANHGSINYRRLSMSLKDTLTPISGGA